MTKNNNTDLIRILAANRADLLWTALSDEAIFRKYGGRTIRDWEFVLKCCHRFNLMAIGGK